MPVFMQGNKHIILVCLRAILMHETVGMKSYGMNLIDKYRSGSWFLILYVWCIYTEENWYQVKMGSYEMVVWERVLLKTFTKISRYLRRVILFGEVNSWNCHVPNKLIDSTYSNHQTTAVSIVFVWFCFVSIIRTEQNNETRQFTGIQDTLATWSWLFGSGLTTLMCC